MWTRWLQRDGGHNQKPKPTTEARRHGENQNQFSPHIRYAQCRLRTQRSTEENWKPKLASEGAEEDQSNKFAHKNEEISRFVLRWAMWTVYSNPEAALNSRRPNGARPCPVWVAWILPDSFLN